MVEVGDILLNRGTGIVGEAIRRLTAEGAPLAQSYSHVGIYAGNNQVYDACYPQGVTLHPLGYNDYNVKRIQLSDAEKSALLNWCESQIGKPYGLTQILEQAVHLPEHFDGNEFDCSVFVNDAFQFIGKPFTKKPNPTPDDIGWSVVGEFVEK